MTPREAKKHFSAYAKKIEQETKRQDTANFILGKYIMYAVNDPKHYPDRPVTHDDAEAEEDDNADGTDRTRLDALFNALAAQSGKLTNTEPRPAQNGPEKPTA